MKKTIINAQTGEVIEEELQEISDEQLKQVRIQEIDDELTAIDNKGLTRVIEDIIDLTKLYLLLPQTTKDLIDRKKELRAEREKLI